VGLPEEGPLGGLRESGGKVQEGPGLLQGGAPDRPPRLAGKLPGKAAALEKCGCRRSPAWLRLSPSATVGGFPERFLRDGGLHPEVEPS